MKLHEQISESGHSRNRSAWRQAAAKAGITNETSRQLKYRQRMAKIIGVNRLSAITIAQWRRKRAVSVGRRRQAAMARQYEIFGVMA
jgi:hypothetical protein